MLKLRSLILCYFLYLQRSEFIAQKKGKLPTSHRYDRVPLLRSRPGGLSRSWLCRTCPAAKIQPFNTLAMIFKLIFI